MIDYNIDKLRVELYQSCQKLSNINLFESAKWAAEALNGLINQNTQFVYPQQSINQEDLLDQERLILAKSYFNCKEFERAANVLKNCTSGDAVFLKLYSTLIAIDKHSTEDTNGSLNTSVVNENNETKNYNNASNYSNLNDSEYSKIESTKDKVNSLNAKLSKILIESNQFLKENENAFLYYLNGIIYNKKKKYKLAQTSLYESLCLFPYNWGCWQELIASLATFEEADQFITHIKTLDNQESALSRSIMFLFFEVVILQEFYHQSELLYENMNYLISIFPNFTFLKIQQFLVSYHELDYYQAESTFDQILLEDPLRLEDLDTYSNMLYVMEKKSKLSYLAQYASSIDKFRPETCCILANFYSMKSEHEKAIMYYKRALTLNKNCLSAWTLMGHEFVELKNSHAAIESYRRAVDTNPKDFRAWYGLGQAYEVLDMHLYALYYYQKATYLQPLDKRMWQAIGNCYEKINQLDEAIKSFEKALSIGKIYYDQEHNNNLNTELEESNYSVEPHICYRLAVLSEKLGNKSDTLKYMKLCFQQEFDWGIGDETAKARLWLARYALENKKFEEAYDLAKDLAHGNAHDIEEARAISRDARNRMK
ncbi:unnamed protein product [Candida verbasci]|uniref:Cdc23 domain-containing protein n=1 Tax=Candida verbasci TaxID=1227364 RepID=A0A9W4X8C3_9ASCO|nr:unnamed protein product [Candida verbasci]